MPGWKQYVALETLDLAEVQDLVNQGVLPYASDAARDAGITVPVTGMVAINTTTGKLAWYDGAVWADIVPDVPIVPNMRNAVVTRTLGATFSDARVNFGVTFASTPRVVVSFWPSGGNFSGAPLALQNLTTDTTGFDIDFVRTDGSGAGGLAVVIQYHAIDGGTWPQ